MNASKKTNEPTSPALHSKPLNPTLVDQTLLNLALAQVESVTATVPSSQDTPRSYFIQIFSQPPEYHLLPLSNYILGIAPKPHLVNHYSSIPSAELVALAMDQNDTPPLHGPLELYLELQRRATTRYLRGSSCYKWDRGAVEMVNRDEMARGERQTKNAVWLRNYDSQWGVVRRNGGGWILGMWKREKEQPK